MRRAGGRLALSAGMRPKARLGLALPLAVGVEGLCEAAEFELASPPPEGFEERLRDSLPEHMHLVSLESSDTKPSLAAKVVGASYEVGVRAAADGDDTADRLQRAAERFAGSDEFVIEESRQGRTRRVDIRQYVQRVQVQARAEGTFTLSFDALITPCGTARPERVVQALADLEGIGLVIEQVTRTRIHMVGEDV